MGFDLFWSDDQMVQESCNLDKDEAEILKPSSPSSASPSPPTSNPPPLFLKRSADVAAIVAPSGEPDPVEQSLRPMRLINRCCSCRKRVGLAGGFRCRCGELFCSRHRYSDTHDCSFDYKAAGREEISKANPLIRAAKIIKI